MSQNVEFRYPGSRPFQDTACDRYLFRGRQKEIKELYQCIRSSKITVIFAKSGMGKTSLLNAGILELLRHEEFFPIHLRLNVPERDITTVIYEKLIQEIQNATHPLEIVRDGIEQDIRQESHNGLTLLEYFQTTEFWSKDNILMTPVLIFDQFEELFTLYRKDARQDFTQQLSALLRGYIPESLQKKIKKEELKQIGLNPPSIKVIISIRQDFLANLDEMSHDIPNIMNNRFWLKPLSKIDAKKAIQEPAKLIDDRFQFSTHCFSYHSETLSSVIKYLSQIRFRDDIIDSDEVEPFQLQVICRYIEQKVHDIQNERTTNDPIVVDHNLFDNESGLRDVFRDFYDKQIINIDSKYRNDIQNLCEKGLISSDGWRLSLEESQIEQKYNVPNFILEKLVETRLLRSEPRVGSHYYELSHDNLVKPIQESLSKRKNKQELLLRSFGSAILAFLIFTSIFFFYNSQRIKADLNQTRKESKEMEDEYNLIKSLLLENVANQYVINPKDAIISISQDLMKKIFAPNPNLHTERINSEYMEKIAYGDHYADKREYGRALLYYDEAKQINQKYPDAYIKIGRSLLNLKQDLNRAIDNYMQALKLNPSKQQQIQIHIDLGSIYTHKKNFERAIVEYQHARKIDPNHPQSYIQLGNMLSQQGKYAQAIEIYHEGIKNTKVTSDLYSNIAHTFSSQNKLDNAILYYRLAIFKSPQNSTLYNNLGLIYCRKQNSDRAIDNFNTAIEFSDDHNPSLPFIYNNRGRLYLNQEEFDKAESDFNKSFSLNQKNGLLYLNRSCLHYFKGMKKEAIRDLHNAITYKSSIGKSIKNDMCFSKLSEDSELKLLLDKLTDDI